MNTPKPGVEKPARLVEFKYFTNASGPGGTCPHAAEPNMKTITQVLVYRQALAQRPDWNHEIAVTVVAVRGTRAATSSMWNVEKLKS